MWHEAASVSKIIPRTSNVHMLISLMSLASIPAPTLSNPPKPSRLNSNPLLSTTCALFAIRQNSHPLFSTPYTLFSKSISIYPQHSLNVAHSLPKTPGGSIGPSSHILGSDLTLLESKRSAKIEPISLRIKLIRDTPGVGVGTPISTSFSKISTYDFAKPFTISQCHVTPALRPQLGYTWAGGEKGPVTFPAFKAGDSFLRGSNGGFDSHTPPPYFVNVCAGIVE